MIRAAKGGDPKARDVVWRWCVAELERFFRPQAADDLMAEFVQRTSVQVFTKFAQAPEDPVELGRWLRGFGRNIRLRWAREVGRYSEVLAEYGEWPKSPEHQLESEFVAREQRDLMAAAIDKLESPYRSTLRLYNELDDMQKIAELLDITRGTVRWRLMCARQMLETLIERSPEPRPQRDAS